MTTSIETASLKPVQTVDDSLHDRTSPLGGQIVVLRVQDSDYGVPIARVQEIVRVPDITPLPEAPEHIEGLINLRGRVLPVLDLPARLGMGHSDANRRSRVVVVKADGGHQDIGLLVDGVSKVLKITPADIEPPAQLSGSGRSVVLGIAKLADQLVLLLDLDAALDGSLPTEPVEPAAA